MTTLLLLLACQKDPDFATIRAEITPASAYGVDSAVGLIASAPLPPELDLTNTVWRLSTEVDAAEGITPYTVTFARDGRLICAHPNDTTPDNDTWSQVGAKVRIAFNDNYAEYDLRFDDWSKISGDAKNVTGLTWTASLVREPGAGTGSYDAALSGQRWSLKYTSPSGEPRDHQLVFHQGGGVWTSEMETAQGHTWTRTPDALTFSFNEGYATYTAKAAGADRFEGQAKNVVNETWSFTLDRTPVASGALKVGVAAPADVRAAVVGTTWLVDDYDANQPTDFTITLNADGSLTRSSFESGNPSGADSWEIVGNKLVFRINDGFSTHENVFVGEGVMLGYAVNNDGYEWPYLLLRQP
ncbi:MAG: hypothetical protein IPN01_34055 [Deltaproteobacteria bacterium]|nr:hypothetical protein [Deltaproteobacteria bacterium]